MVGSTCHTVVTGPITNQHGPIWSRAYTRNKIVGFKLRSHWMCYFTWCWSVTASNSHVIILVEYGKSPTFSYS
ncbi:hypothetical protein XELAEV_18003021mg [Xenopus laevis]|uniref:Uncharacterized protein n=1 Tax=Xenopus laevis TaxID=8355 RepID=A0A974GZ81_XENLA|nr:hypothetical protein XELAEV_18003021mg [Xenopus laevis]